MFTRLALPLLASVVVLSSGLAEAKTYTSPKEAALRQGSYRFTRNTFVRNKLGKVGRKRVISRALGNTAAGNFRYRVQTRKHINGKPVTTIVTVKPLKNGKFMPYRGKKINIAKKTPVYYGSEYGGGSYGSENSGGGGGSSYGSEYSGGGYGGE